MAGRFGDINLIGLTEDKAIISTPTQLRKNIISSRFSDLLKESVSAVLGFTVDIELVSMEENLKILWRCDKIVSLKEDGEVFLPRDAVCSMNFFGFTPKAFESFNRYWDEFKRASITEPKKECLLPSGASDMVVKNEGSIKVLTSNDRWFGMTYPEDKPAVVAELRKMIESGYYPEKLWDKE